MKQQKQEEVNQVEPCCSTYVRACFGPSSNSSAPRSRDAATNRNRKTLERRSGDQKSRRRKKKSARASDRAGQLTEKPLAVTSRSDEARGHCYTAKTTSLSHTRTHTHPHPHTLTHTLSLILSFPFSNDRCCWYSSQQSLPKILGQNGKAKPNPSCSYSLTLSHTLSLSLSSLFTHSFPSLDFFLKLFSTKPGKVQPLYAMLES